MCKNGQCIASDELCDGRYDCRDKSDETIESCVHVQCPEYAFRCAYGACVNGNAECNNEQDCVDNSDETSISCPGVLEGFQLSGNCVKREEEFQCLSGECIQIDNACDGKKHCRDGSDETVKICASTYCPSFAFRCGYGACISGNAKCDGVKDCSDGSDELKSLCGNNHITESTIDYNIPTRPSRITTTEISMTQRGCIIDYVDNLIFEYTSDHSYAQPGDYVNEFISITYKCRPKHILNGPNTNYCLNGKWSKEYPTCTKYCSYLEIVGRATTKAVCEYNNTGISCNQPLQPGTRATISCQIGYTKPDRVVQEILVCTDNGEWDYHPFRCEQVCGIEPVETHQFVIGGNKINNTLVPWHASIYSSNRGRYEQICAGTIINARVILSAAHCFWNPRTERIFDKSLFAVGVGKYYRDFYADEPLPPQFLNLTDLQTPPGYKDVALSFQNDIAVLVLEGFITYKTYIKPICIEFQSYSNRSIKSNLIGRVAGWGKVETGESSNELRVVDLPTVSYDECVEKTEPEFKLLVTGDKFCVGGQQITQSVCEGDSGGGFSIPKVVGGIKTYFLWGIVSNGLNTKGVCSGSYFTAFTNIQYHSSMIIEFETKYRPK